MYMSSSVIPCGLHGNLFSVHIGRTHISCTHTHIHLSVQGMITDILEENVVQPLLVSTSAIKLAAETVRSVLKIDDIVS